MEMFSATLPNGIRLVHYPVAGKVAHLGIFINAGTRDELEHEHGVAHLIEHTIFKGTRKRSLYQVLNRLENVGADLNAYTTKEETCIHASFLVGYYDRTIELFQDIFFHSVFPEKEIEKEKQVVMDEIRSYLDNPAEQVFDDFEDLVFEGHPLGKNILGTARSLKKINREKINGFIEKNYRLDQVVIASAGNITFERLLKKITRHFSDSPLRETSRPRIPFDNRQCFTREVRKKTYQVHCVIGSTAYRFGDPRRIPLALLVNLLGGPALNSRLSFALRERNGLTYHCEANYTAYSDTGITSVYFACDPQNYPKAHSIVLRELKRLREERIGTLQLHLVRKQLTGQLSIGHESNLAVMMSAGKSYLLQNRYDPLEWITEQIGKVTADKLLEVANEIFDEKSLSMLTFRP